MVVGRLGIPTLSKNDDQTKPNQTTKNTMTKSEFVEICAEYYVHHLVALENDAVVEAIKSGDTESLREALKNEF